MRTNLESLKNLLPEVDYQALLAQMPGQSHPRRKLKELQNKGYLIRVKKGFYVFDPHFIGRPYSPEIVANLVYGPSYVSMEYALSKYALIPERVDELTSITSQKNKIFRTPIGLFSYRHTALALYTHGISIGQTDDGRSYIIAGREKALLDLFTVKFKNTARPQASDIRPALEEDLRVDLQELARSMNRQVLLTMRPAYKNRRWCKLLIDFLLEEL